MTTQSNDADSDVDSMTTREPKIWHLLVATLAVVGLWILNWLYGSDIAVSERGQFGDTFGVVNALFSGLAFAGLVYAIMMQRYEVALAKKDARITKQILNDQTAHLEEQNLRETQRSSEDSFFKLLTSHQAVLESVYALDANTKINVNGRHAIAKLVKRLRHQEYLGNNTHELYAQRLDNFLKNFTNNFSHYIRSLECILEHVSTHDGIMREYFSFIIRGQLSNAEQELIFHCARRAEYSNLKKLIEQNHLLIGILDECVYFPEFKNDFSPSAFSALP